MRFDDDTLNWVFDRTDGRCHICGKKLCFGNYGLSGRRGAWEVEHSVPRARGGTDHRNNLFAACIVCNREKATFSARTARSWSGRKAAPHSKQRKAEVRRSNTLKGGLAGALLGSLVAGPAGLVLGALGGAAAGNAKDPDGR